MMITTAITGKVTKGKLRLDAKASLFEDGTKVILLPLEYWLRISGGEKEAEK